MLRNLIVLPDGTEIFSGNPRGNAVASAEYRQKVNSGTELTIGSVCASCLSMKLIAGGGNLSIGAGTEFSYYKVSDNGERTKIGLFTMEKPTRSGANSYQIEAYDRVSWLDKDLTDWLSSLNSWPYSVENFARMVCEACGLTLAEKAIDYSFQIVGENLILTYSGDQPQYSIGNDGHLTLAYAGDVPDVSINENGHLVDESGGTPFELPNGSYQIRKFSGSGVTGRMLMQWLGQITCRFIRANADGKIEFAWYTDKGKEITTRGEFAYFGGGLSYEDFTVAEIQKVQIKASENDNGTVYPDGSEEELNTYKITGNYLLTAETGDELKPVARAIFEQLQGVTYTPCKVSIQATTEINAGDIVHITDRNGVTITTYVMSKTNKGQKDTLECTGSYKRDSSTATNTLTMKALNGKVLDIKKDVDGLRVENKDTAGKVAKLELSTTEITASVESVKKTSEEALKEAQKNATDLTNYANQVSGSLTDLQNQIDGAIETWFYDYEPTTTNAPASSWTTTEDKNKHLGDLFYIVDNEDKGGLVYRWALTNSVYGWVLVEDTEVAKALETASKAKDTADKKRRVFVSHPTPPYDVGDLWTNNTDLYVCQTARSSGNYIASDWKLATEYTTEKAVKALIKVAEESISLSVKNVEEKADGAASAASKAQKTADGIEVGGRNLIIGASKYRESTPAVTGTSSDAYVYLTDTSVMLEKGKTYTLQACSDLPWSTGHGSGAGLGKGTIWIASVDRKYHRVFLGDGVTAGRYVWKFEHAGDTGEYQIRVNGYVTPAKFWDFKVESGNKPTDWTPAPEDTDEDIKGLQDDLASISDEVSVLKVTSKGVDMVSEDSNGRLVSFIGNRDTGGAWEAKYTKNGAVTSALYFDFAKGRFVFEGEIVATSGNIGGWSLSGSKLYGGDGTTLKTAAFQVPSADNTWVLAIGGSSHTSYSDCPFRVDKYGSVYATNGEFSGTITAEKGKIGGFNIGSTYLSTNNKVSYNGSISGVYVGNDGIGLGAGKFYVNSNGYLYASSGKIASFSIDDVAIRANDDEKGTSVYLDVNQINLGHGKFWVNSYGYLHAGWGTIGAWNILQNGILGSAVKSGDNWYGIALDATDTALQNSARVFAIGHIGSGGESSYTDAINGSWANAAFSIRADGSAEASNLTISGGLIRIPVNYKWTSDIVNGTQVGGNEIKIMSDHAGIVVSNNTIAFSDNNAPQSTALMKLSLGVLDLYGTVRANGSAIVTGSDARWKNTIEDFTPAHDVLFDNLRPRTYKWNDGTSDRTHSGFIVQEVVEAVEKSGLTTKDFAAVVNFKGENGEDDGWGLRYEEMISLNTWQIQKLKARIAELEGRLKYETN